VDLARESCDPEAFALYAYANVELIAQAAKKANSLDPKKVAETLRDGTAWKNVIGDLSYDAKGDRKAPAFVLFSVKKTADGKFDSVHQ
jgi:branched-chain amino acid transport system substrate-binding protein